LGSGIRLSGDARRGVEGFRRRNGASENGASEAQEREIVDFFEGFNAD